MKEQKNGAKQVLINILLQKPEENHKGCPSLCLKKIFKYEQENILFYNLT